MQLLLDFLGASSSQKEPMVLYPFRASQLFQAQLPEKVNKNWQKRCECSNGEVMVIFEHARNWILLGHQQQRDEMDLL